VEFEGFTGGGGFEHVVEDFGYFADFFTFGEGRFGYFQEDGVGKG
jgi:hypothetical protein